MHVAERRGFDLWLCGPGTVPQTFMLTWIARAMVCMSVET